MIHRQVRIAPFAENAQTDEILFLVFDLFFGIGAGFFLHFGGGQVFAVQFFDLDFDRHAVAIPAWNVRGVETGKTA